MEQPNNMELLMQFERQLLNEEKSAATTAKYLRDCGALQTF